MSISKNVQPPHATHVGQQEFRNIKTMLCLHAQCGGPPSVHHAAPGCGRSLLLTSDSTAAPSSGGASSLFWAGWLCPGPAGLFMQGGFAAMHNVTG